MEIQLLFSEPMYVSFADKFDRLILQISENVTLISKDGHELSEISKMMNKTIPRQIEHTNFQKSAQTISSSVSSISQGTSTGSIVVGVLWANLINELLKTYQPLQLMLHFPIFNVWFPANIMIQFKNFVPIVNFDLMSEIKPYTDFLEKISQANAID